MLLIDQKIIAQVNQGDAKAFERLYTAYYVYLCAVATKYVFKAEIAQEIVNDVFLNVWNNHTELIHPVNAYLIRAVKNRCLNHIQRKNTQEVSMTDVAEQLSAIQEQAVKAEEHPLAYLENKELEVLIYEAVGTLPPKCRLIFEQYIYQSKTYEEIAQANQISNSTVRVQIRIGLLKLRELLGDYYYVFLFLFFFPTNDF